MSREKLVPEVLAAFLRAPVLGKNIDNLIKDFEERTVVPANANKEMYSTMFVCFVSGVTTVMDVDSNFNKKYVSSEAPPAAGKDDEHG